MTRARDLANLLTGGQTIETDDNSVQLTLKSTDADANVGPILDVIRDSASPADGDEIGRFRFKGDDDAGNETTYAFMQVKINDATDASDDGELEILTRTNGSNRSRIELLPTETVFNEDSQDIDFRVESDGNANMLFVDAGNDKVGIGTNAPTNKLSVVGGDFGTLLLDNADSSHGTQLLFQANGTANTGADIQMSDAGGLKFRTLAVEHMSFHTSSSAGSPSEHMRISTGGNIRMHQSSTDSPGLGNTTTGHAFRSDNIVALSSASGYLSINRNGDGTRIQFNNSGNTRGTITVTGTTTAYNTSSDRRLKSNIQDAASASSKIDAMKVRQFDWTEDGKHQDYGMIAQELQSVEPLAVSGSEDSKDMMGVDYSKLVPMLIKEIQELRSRVAALES